MGPSVLAGDLSNLAFETHRVIRAGADYVHLDMFDGNWIKGAFTFGPMVVKAIRHHEPLAYLDVHLCVLHPEQYLEEMKNAGASRVTLHFEALSDSRAAAERAHGLGLEVGLALAPETFLDESLLSVAELFDAVLVMTVPPGFGGQAFMPEMLPKIRRLREAFPTKALEVDGGVTPTTAAMAAAAGANEAVAGSSVFHSHSLRRAIRRDPVCGFCVCVCALTQGRVEKLILSCSLQGAPAQLGARTANMAEGAKGAELAPWKNASE